MKGGLHQGEIFKRIAIQKTQDLHITRCIALSSIALEGDRFKWYLECRY